MADISEKATTGAQGTASGLELINVINEAVNTLLDDYPASLVLELYKKLPTPVLPESTSGLFQKIVDEADEVDEAKAPEEAKIQQCLTIDRLSEALEARLKQVHIPGQISRACRYVLIVCDGLIGCGKTTFLAELGEIPGVQVFREPVEERAEKSWWPLLAKFYTARSMLKSASLQAQKEAVSELERTVWAHHHRIATQRTAHAITERGCMSTLRVFCEALKEEGLLEESLFERFLADFREVEKNMCHETLSIHFTLSVHEAWKRVQQRAEEEGRYFEKDITEKYLTCLSEYYEKLYKGRPDVIKIDSNQPSDEMRRCVADELEHPPEGKYTKPWQQVLEEKGFPASKTQELLDGIIGWFRNPSNA